VWKGDSGKESRDSVKSVLFMWSGTSSPSLTRKGLLNELFVVILHFRYCTDRMVFSLSSSSSVVLFVTTVAVVMLKFIAYYILRSPYFKKCLLTVLKDSCTKNIILGTSFHLQCWSTVQTLLACTRCNHSGNAADPVWAHNPNVTV